ncbi:disintegrin and metalloproteinase domain-containing protein 11-like [Oscarella lobularis]|uniref:disintegrin and metalloproteinase domain-containing protein 11-like n=1 Tax=Oscarella lobularis TaxID=121494 RepID=UPI003313B842
MRDLLYVFLALRVVLGGPSVDVNLHEKTILFDESGQKLAKRFTKLLSGQHVDEISLRVAAFGRNFTLDLSLNKRLFAGNYKEVYFSDESGEEMVTYGAENCYYHGTIRGIEADSSVVVSTCNGLSGSFANGTSPESHYYIEPEKDGEFHLVYRASDLANANALLTCGLGNHSFAPTPNAVVANVKKDFQRARRSVLTETKYVELLIVNDYRQYKKRGTVAATGDRAKAIANFVDSVYKTLNVRVALVAVETWNNGDKISISSDAGTTLDDFLVYRENTLVSKYSHDSGQLVSNLDFAGTTIGIAPLKGMCRLSSSGGVNQDTSTSDQVASTMAHEMGHTFGMEHDDLQGRNCKCTDTSGAGCLMASSSNGIAATIWSDCSRSDLNTFLSAGSGSCLFNVPTQLFGDPVCGNGFVETGEECDCGSTSECATNDPCCEPGKCKLKSTSQCSKGSCCENCKFKAAGSSCRATATDCDLVEYCGGSSKDCPENLYKQDGTSCDNGASYCYGGECKTLDKQCKYVWGSSASVAGDVCYTSGNKRGDQYGHCGTSASNFYIGCTDSNVRCGLLQCQGGGQFPILGGSSQVGTLTYTISGNRIPCKGASIDLGSDVRDPGLVEDGTRCDTNKVCVSHACTSISSLSVVACPRGSNSLTCSGNGVCNNVGDCHCNSGYVPPSCSSPAPAAVDGAWGAWGAWSSCSATCDGGTRTRIRYCDNPSPSNGGSSCPGSSRGQQACNSNSCPVPIDGAWSAWGSWTTCTVSCGSGIRYHFRQCNNPPPQNGGLDCSGARFEDGSCNTRSCPVDGGWSNWLPWSACTQSCNSGTRTRTRSCDNPSPAGGGSQCSGSNSNSQNCNEVSCLVNRDGEWGAWTVWSSCSKLCGSGGTQTRSRQCDNPPPLNAGKTCSESSTDSQSCTGQQCPRDGQWGTWAPWSACPVTCGGGVTYRLRTCSNPTPADGGKDCSGDGVDEILCGTLDCTVRPGGNDTSGGNGNDVVDDGPNTESKGGGNGGVIAGAVIGVLALLGIGVGVGVYVYRRKRSYETNSSISRSGMYEPTSTEDDKEKYSGYQPPKYHGSQENLLDEPEPMSTTFIGDPFPPPTRKPLPPTKRLAPAPPPPAKAPAPKPPAKPYSAPAHRPPPPPGKPVGKPPPPPLKPGVSDQSGSSPKPKPKPRPGAVSLLPPGRPPVARKPPKQWPPS